MAGYSGDANLIASSIQYIINVIMRIPALIWIDRWGRRPTLLIDAAFMLTWMFANAGIMATYGGRPGRHRGNRRTIHASNRLPSKGFDHLHIPMQSPGVLPRGCIHQSCTHCVCMVRPCHWQHRATGFSTPRWDYSCPLPLPIFAGRRTLFSAFSVPPCSFMCSSYSLNGRGNT